MRLITIEDVGTMDGDYGDDDDDEDDDEDDGVSDSDSYDDTEVVKDADTDQGSGRRDGDSDCRAGMHDGQQDLTSGASVHNTDDVKEAASVLQGPGKHGSEKPGQAVRGGQTQTAKAPGKRRDVVVDHDRGNSAGGAAPAGIGASASARLPLDVLRTLNLGGN